MDPSWLSQTPAPVLPAEDSSLLVASRYAVPSPVVLPCAERLTLSVLVLSLVNCDWDWDPGREWVWEWADTVPVSATVLSLYGAPLVVCGAGVSVARAAPEPRAEGEGEGLPSGALALKELLGLLVLVGLVDGEVGVGALDLKVLLGLLVLVGLVDSEVGVGLEGGIAWPFSCSELAPAGDELVPEHTLAGTPCRTHWMRRGPRVPSTFRA